MALAAYLDDAPLVNVEAEESLESARSRYFRALGSSGIDYDAWWIRIPIGGIEMGIPNPPAHGRALRAHDLHHVLTGYSTSLVGECEISAWELGGGSGAYVAAIGFDVAGTGLGLLLAPRRTLVAFARGRRGRNLFRRRYGHELLDRSVLSVRRELGIGPDPEPGAADVVRFAFWSSLGVLSLALWPLTWLLISATCLMPPPREHA
ncbi:MAG: hypothetical protein KC776_24255 [Myxococcales bacterium]|nr:hypothetical protein [Myxococcales bacterium]MCB9582778.1 hypothetical protein [Polyangiaceae bacterium]